jgi:hypothetical protein
MADKTDTNDLLSSLQRVLLEYRGMKYILDQFPLSSGDNWRRLMKDYREQSGYVRPVAELLDELRGSLQSGQHDGVPPELLIRVLNETTLL